MTDRKFYQEQCGGNTIGAFVRAVLRINTPEDAARFYRGNVADVQAQIDAGKWESRHTAIEAAQANIGWCFGEGMDSQRIQMWTAACGASHPIFGTSKPTAQEALQAGLKAATLDGSLRQNAQRSGNAANITGRSPKPVEPLRNRLAPKQVARLSKTKKGNS